MTLFSIFLKVKTLRSSALETVTCKITQFPIPISEVLQSATITEKQKKVSCGRRTRMMGHVMLGLLFERFRYEQSVKNKKVATLNNGVK